MPRPHLSKPVPRLGPSASPKPVVREGGLRVVVAANPAHPKLSASPARVLTLLVRPCCRLVLSVCRITPPNAGVGPVRAAATGAPEPLPTPLRRPIHGVVHTFRIVSHVVPASVSCTFGGSARNRRSRIPARFSAVVAEPRNGDAKPLLAALHPVAACSCDRLRWIAPGGVKSPSALRIRRELPLRRASVCNGHPYLPQLAIRMWRMGKISRCYRPIRNLPCPSRSGVRRCCRSFAPQVAGTRCTRREGGRTFPPGRKP